MFKEPILAADEIQGNVLRGFNSQYLALIGLQFATGVARPTARDWLARLPLSTLAGVARFRLARRMARRFDETLPVVLINIAFSARGCEALGLATTKVRDPYFRKAMGDVARELGDPQLQSYLYGRTHADTPDILLILGADDSIQLQETARGLERGAECVGMNVLFREHGAKLLDEKEHFGFRDGMSEVTPRGRLSDEDDDFLYPRTTVGPAGATGAAPGRPLVWPGQFVFGYHGQLSDKLPTSNPVTGGEAWMTNGSFLVYRRLRQDVPGFRRWRAEQAAATTQQAGRVASPATLAVRVGGRQPDGTRYSVLLSGQDQATPHDSGRVNAFGYGSVAPPLTVIEPDGQRRTIRRAPVYRNGNIGPRRTPIRKVDPRGVPTDKQNMLRLQLLRRGIPYGPRYEEDEQGPVDRGLLFLAYQTSFADQFVALSRDWRNHLDRLGIGGEDHDLLVGQGGREIRFGSLPSADAAVPYKATVPEQFVTATGGAFLFSPAVSLVRRLATAV